MSKRDIIHVVIFALIMGLFVVSFGLIHEEICQHKNEIVSAYCKTYHTELIGEHKHDIPLAYVFANGSIVGRDAIEKYSYLIEK